MCGSRPLFNLLSSWLEWTTPSFHRPYKRQMLAENLRLVGPRLKGSACAVQGLLQLSDRRDPSGLVNVNNRWAMVG